MPLTRSPLWVFAKPEALQGGSTDPKRLIDACKRFQQQGVNGLAAWDTDWGKPQPWESYFVPMWEKFASWASDAKFDICLQLLQQNETIEAWWGVEDCTEHGSVGGERYICLAHPGVHPVYEQILDNVLKVLPAGSPLVGAFPYYDEFRLQGTHQRCHKPGGGLLAAHAAKTFALMRQHAPHWDLFTWSDWGDPNENAKTPYYSVYGGMKGAGAGLDPGIIILNWDTKGDTEDAAFAYFDALGCQQLFSGFYDGAGGDGVSASDELKAKRKYQAAYSGLIGYMYTTWEDDFSQIGPYLTKDGWDAPRGQVTPPPPPQKWAPCPSCVGHTPPYPAGQVPA